MTQLKLVHFIIFQEKYTHGRSFTHSQKFGLTENVAVRITYIHIIKVVCVSRFPSEILQEANLRSWRQGGHCFVI